MRPLLVLGTSGRLLAWAARAAGFSVDVADLCGDHDCRASAGSVHRLPATPGAPWVPDAAATRAWVARWSDAHPDGVLVPGSGFETCPDLLTDLARLRPLAGNPGAVVRAAKDPWQLARLCDHAGLHTPALAPSASTSTSVIAGDALCKPVGGSGGFGIAPLTGASAVPARHYVQARQAGVPVSLLFFADPAQSATVAVSVHTQHLAPCADHPFRFGGLVRIPHPDASLLHALQQAADRLSTALGLRGLNGLDGLWDGTRLWVLEINPRPPLSLGLHTTTAAAQLLRAHIEGTALAITPPAPTGLNAGVALVYAARTLSIPADFRFPHGCHDVPVLPHECAPGAPLCSVHVDSGGIEELRARVRDLRECLLPVAGVESVSSL